MRARSRTVLIVVLCVFAVYLVYLLRTPIAYLVLAIWALFAIVYQQFENYVVQPRIQSKAVSIDPFIVVIAALVGGTLLGVVGALLAIPGAATIQIALKDYLRVRPREAAAG